MEFITEEIKTKLNLTDEAIKELTPLYNDQVANIKKEFEGVANTNAEKIIEGAVKTTEDATGVKREIGEKNADYLKRAGNVYLSSLKTELETAKAEYQSKLKDFKGDEATKAELEKAKADLDEAKKTLADFDTIKERADKYEPLETEYKSMKKQVAWQGVKPTFPDTINPYEASAKWDGFIKATEEVYNVEIVDGEAICVDKKNEHRTIKLKDLVDKDAELAKLLQGRQQQGAGGKQVDMQKVDGVPFEIPKGATSEDRSKLIRDYLLTQGVGATHPDYATKFAELNTKIKTAK